MHQPRVLRRLFLLELGFGDLWFMQFQTRLAMPPSLQIKNSS